MKSQSRLRTGPLVAAVALIVSGCSLVRHDDAKTPAKNLGPPTAVGRSTTTTAVMGPELLSAGTEPRRLLRLRLAAGSAATLAVTTDLAVTQDAVGGPQTVDPPPLVQTLRERVGRIGPDGVAAVTFRVLSVGIGEGNALTPPQALELTTALQTLGGIRGSGRLTDQGRLTGVRLIVPSGLPPTVTSQVASLRTQVEAQAAQLPTEAVGVGGSWRTDNVTVLGGVTVKQTVTTLITAIEGDTVRYESTSASVASRQPVPLSGLPAGATATLAASTLVGTAQGMIDLRSLGATSTTSTTGTQVVEVARLGSPPASLTQHLTITTRSESQT